MSTGDAHFMHEALQQAALASQAGEVPVGAVVVHQGRIMGRGHNRSIAAQDISAHAEIQALRQASAALGNHRLEGCTLYVTLEPCIMCSGAILGARLARVVYGAREPRSGAAGSVLDVFAEPRLNHQTRIEAGVLAEECGLALQQFFQARRHCQQLQRSQTFLREDALRCEGAGLAPWPDGVQSHLRNDLPSLEGLRLHLLTAGQGRTAVLALHGTGDWSAAMVPAAAVLAAAGLALVAPDLPGFGLSDKPKKAAWHRLDTHAAVLRELIDQLPQQQVLLAAPPQMQGLLALLASHPRVLAAFSVASDPLAPALQDLPYPDAGHRVGPRHLPALLQAAPPSPAARHLGRDWAQALAAMGY